MNGNTEISENTDGNTEDVEQWVPAKVRKQQLIEKVYKKRKIEQKPTEEEIQEIAAGPKAKKSLLDQKAELIAKGEGM
jgi:hypothetical protein